MALHRNSLELIDYFVNSPPTLLQDFNLSKSINQSPIPGNNSRIDGQSPIDIWLSLSSINSGATNWIRF